MKKNYDNLYLIRVRGVEGESLVKFGYASNMEQRLKAYYYHNPLMEVIGTYYDAAGQDFERYIHSQVEATVMNEWYSEDELPLLLEYIESGSSILTTNALKARSLRAVRELGDEIRESRIAEEVKSYFSVGSKVPSAVCKKVLSEVYGRHKRRAKAKATDLGKYFDTRTSTTTTAGVTYRYIEVLREY